VSENSKTLFITALLQYCCQ